MQHQFVHKKKMVEPAVPNSGILVEPSVTVYPIHIDQGFSKVSEEDNINYCTTVRGPDILHSTESKHFS